jgi:hypothetical protein
MLLELPAAFWIEAKAVCFERPQYAAIARYAANPGAPGTFRASKHDWADADAGTASGFDGEKVAPIYFTGPSPFCHSE